MCSGFLPILLSFQRPFAFSLIRCPYFAGAILAYPGYFLSRFAHFLEPYYLPAYLLEPLFRLPMPPNRVYMLDPDSDAYAPGDP